MKKYFLFVLIAFLSLSGFAQAFSIPEPTLGKINDHIRLDQSTIEEKLDVKDLSNVNGSPYWNDDFKKGIVHLKSKDNSTSGFLRYRIFDDVFEYKEALNSSDETYVLDHSRDVEMTLEGNTFVWLMNLPAAGEGQSMKEGYALILERGEDENDVTLYKRFKLIYTPAEAKSNSYEMPNKAQLKGDSYYMVGINDNLVMANPSKKKATDAFPDHKAELQKYIKDNKLKFKKKNREEDLIELVKYYNSL